MEVPITSPAVLRTAAGFAASTAFLEVRLSATRSTVTDVTAGQGWGYGPACVRITVEAQPTAGMMPASGAQKLRTISFQKKDSCRTFQPDSALDPVFPAATMVNGTAQCLLTPLELSASFRDQEDGRLHIANGYQQPDMSPVWQYPSPVEAYLPLVSLYAEGRPCGLALSTDPRAPWGLTTAARGVSASRLFFFPMPGAIDSGYHNGDVQVGYTLRVALPRTDPSSGRVEWARLFNEHYCSANPWLAAGPSLPPG
jgi:hypothetical protein